jgi:hypothetical protein
VRAGTAATEQEAIAQIEAMPGIQKNNGGMWKILGDSK